MSDSQETMGKAEPIGFIYLVTVVTEGPTIDMLVAEDWWDAFIDYRAIHGSAVLVNVQQITAKQAKELEDDI